ncbi:hypothetical protein FOA52_008546 [Chlamydomonas sp. UWO 241]|nr:hypothetical protein FOA52_008546 [Chlamydomonas sp. UWO 241]
MTQEAAAGKAKDTGAVEYSRELMGPTWDNRGRLSDEMMGVLLNLPGTRGMLELRDRADALTAWKLALQKGYLPNLADITWPQEPFKSKFAKALQDLEMPRFTRRYPAILNTLLKQMLALVEDFEEKFQAANTQAKSKQQQQRQEQAPKPQKSQSQSEDQPQNQSQEEQQKQEQDQDMQGSGAGAGDSEETDDKGEDAQQGEGGGQPGEDEAEEMELDDETLQQMLEQLQEAGKEQEQQQGGDGKKTKLNISLEASDGKVDERDGDNPLQKELDKMAEDIVKGFKSQMAEVMENLQNAEMAFDDLNALLDSSEGFDLSRGTWRKSGWKELQELRQVLEDCPELRKLVRQLGRGGGKGPMRRAPEEVAASGYPPGVIRSPLQPEEVRGLTKSNDLGRMLPAEMALLAHGWPRKVREDGTIPAGAVMVRARDSDSDSSTDSGDDFQQEYYLPGARAARMLHRVRRAERNLMSYERCGWMDDQPALITDRMEVRPAAELGPIILCLDTSGSMQGAREVVAKALALECLRGAHRQRRGCFIYAFSGPDDVQELELKVDVESLDKLLDFLSCSFMGGTDVDKPLALSLQRLQSNEWMQSDILMVTDGEIPMPDKKILDTIKGMNERLGLEVHGLLVASHVTEPMRQLCTDVHVFKSWTAVGGNDWQY